MAALLHDVIEDQPVDRQTLLSLGVPERVVELVELLTRRPNVSEEDYYARIGRDPTARMIKLADIADNADPRRLRRLDADERARLMKKYANGRHLLGSATDDEQLER